jgi:competence protein ComEC
MRYPAAPPALAVLAGCACGSVWALDRGAAASAVWLACLTAAIAWRFRSGSGCVIATIAGCWAAGAALASLGAWEAVHTPLRAALVQVRGPDAVSDSTLDPLEVEGRLAEDAAVTASGIRLSLRVRTIEEHEREIPAAGGVLITVTGSAAPSAADGWRRGRVLRLPVLLRRPARYLNPGLSDQEAALARRGITMVGVAKSPLLVQVRELGSVPAEWAGKLRSWARRVFEQTVGQRDPRSSAILRAVILGDRAGLDDETELRLQEAGTYHVLAISGGNIAILAGMLLLLGRLLSGRHALVNVLVAALLIAYAYLVGGGASVNRATAMAVIYLIAQALDHRAPPLNILAASAGLGAAVDPLVLYDTGAWLTYGATLAILVGTPWIVGRLQPATRIARAACALLAASLAAELALFPIGAFAFSRVTAAGLVVNFAAIPLMTVVQISGMALLAAARVAPSAVPALAEVAHLSAWGLVESARFVDVAPWVTTRLAPPGLAVLAVYYLGWIAWWGARDVRIPGPRGFDLARAARVAAWGLIVGAGLWVLVAPVVNGRLGGQLEVTFIDVGQGDATLVRCPGGQALLIDAGGAGGGSFDVGRRVVEPVVWARGVRRLSRFVLSHGDADHAGGAASIVHDLSPPEIWEGVPVPRDDVLRAIRREADAAGAAWRTVQRGDSIALGEVQVTIRHPPPAEWERQRVRNDDSVVVEIRYRDVSIVLPGDVETSAERALAVELTPARIRILQAPHHGSATSSTWPLIRAARPSIVVVSAGRGNRYGHPHRAVLERYREAGVPVFRTDLEGAITVHTDGRTARIRSMTGRELAIAGTMRGEAVRRP